MVVDLVLNIKLFCLPVGVYSRACCMGVTHRAVQTHPVEHRLMGKGLNMSVRA